MIKQMQLFGKDYKGFDQLRATSAADFEMKAPRRKMQSS